MNLAMNLSEMAPGSAISVSTKIPIGSLPRFDSRSSAHYARALLRDCTGAGEWLKNEARNDSKRADALTFAFARQLEYIFKEIYEIEYPKLRAAEFMPVNTEVPAGELTFTYRMWDKKGQARIVHNFAADLPKADVVAKEFPAPVITLGASYGYSIFDLQRAALTNAPLEQLKANAARWSIEYLMEQIACSGSAADGVSGMVNVPGLVGTNQVSTGTWLAQIASIGAATPAEPAAAVAVMQAIMSDVNAMVFQIRDATKGIHKPDTCLLPTPLYNVLDTTGRSPAFTDDTFLDYLEKMTHMDFEYWPQLDVQGAGATGRVMVYEKDPEVIQLIMAQPFTQAPPQARNLNWEVPCYAQIGGAMAIRPQAMTYMDGLSDGS